MKFQAHIYRDDFTRFDTSVYVIGHNEITGERCYVTCGESGFLFTLYQETEGVRPDIKPLFRFTVGVERDLIDMFSAIHEALVPQPPAAAVLDEVRRELAIERGRVDRFFNVALERFQSHDS